jgi:hypothetical protein
MRIEVLISYTGRGASFYAFHLRPDIAPRYAKFMEEVMNCAVNVALLLPVELIQQPLKDAFRVCGQSRQAPHSEPWLARI